MNERFARQRLIPGWKQEHLANARVIVVGMGALGNEVSKVLAMSGVGELILCDHDIISESNLSRTLLFRHQDIGQRKVEVAAQALKDLAPGIIVTPRPARLIHGVGLAELRDASLVVSCLDSRSARLQLAGRCQLVKAPYIDGGTHPWGGEVRPYFDPDGPCYGCSLSAEERAITDAPWSCLDTQVETPTGSAAPSSALVGTWMGMLAVRFLMGAACPNEILSIDGSRGTTTLVELRRDPECPLHQKIGETIKVSVGANQTIDALRQELPPQSVPLAWEPVQQQVECPNCGFSESRWGHPAIAPCPNCQKPLRPRTTLELDTAPGELTLASLGIAPREILAVRTPEGWLWIELKD